MTARARTAAACLGFACVGALASGLTAPLPAWLRIVAALAGVVAAPALLLATPLARVAGVGRGAGALRAATAPVAALSLHAFVAATFTVLGAPFSLYATCTTWALLLGFAAVLGAGIRRGAVLPPRLTPSRAALRVLAAVAALVAFAAVVAPRYGGAEDAFDHMGYVRRTVTLDAMQPDGVLALPRDAAPPAPDARKGAFHAVAALVTDLSGADPVEVWPLLRVVMYPLAVLGFAAFASVFAGGPALVLCLALFFLSYGGTAFRLVDASAYGQNLAAAWYWVVAAITLRDASAPRTRGTTIAFLAAGGVLVHLGVAMHLGVLALTLAVFAPALGTTRAAGLRASLRVGVGVAVGLAFRAAADGVWSAPNEIHAHLEGVMTVSERWFVASPMEILRQHGMVFLGGLCLLPVTAVAARSDSGARATIALAVIPVCVAFVPPLATISFERASYMAFRTLLNAPVLPAAALTVAWLVRRARARGPAVRFAAAILLAAWGLAFVGPALRAFIADTGRLAESRRGSLPVRDLDRAVSGLPAGATILSDPVTSYRLSALTSHRFVAVLHQHANPGDPFALDRLAAVRDVISPYALPSTAADACRRYAVDFVVLSAAGSAMPDYLTPGHPALVGAAWDRLRSLPGAFQEFARGADFVVMRFNADAAASDEWSGMPPAPVAHGEGPPAACNVAVPRALFDVTGFAVTPGAASPGDSLLVTFGYDKSMTTRFGPGIVFHVRFDHESIPAGRRFPGDKYLRRARERAGGVLYRFRADLRAGHGVQEPDLWPVGTPLVERFTVAIPPAAAPGRYRVEVRAVEETLLPNFDLTDLLFNRDHYSGAACGTVDVVGGGGAR